MERDLAAIQGLAVVQPVRAARISVRNSQPILLAVDIVRLSPQARQRAIPVNTGRIHQLATQGRGVIVSDNFAAHERVRVGDLSICRRRMARCAFRCSESTKISPIRRARS